MQKKLIKLKLKCLNIKESLSNEVTHTLNKFKDDDISKI